MLLMDLSKSPDTVDRTQIWAALYKKGLPLANILHIRQGHQNTTLRAKHQGGYGTNDTNNVGVFQGSVISAPLFIIYLGDMMDDYKAIGRKAKPPTGETLQRTHRTGTKTLLKQLQTKTTDTEAQRMNTNKYIRKIQERRIFESETQNIHQQTPTDIKHVLS